MLMLHDIRLSARALRAISEYVEPFEDSADVMLLRCGEDVLVGQGDDRSVFDAKGDRRDDDGTIGTYDQTKAEAHQRILAAVAAGAELVLHDDGLQDHLRISGDQAENVVSLLVNAIGTVLENPDATLVDVMSSNWEESGLNDWREELGDDLIDAAIAQRGDA